MAERTVELDESIESEQLKQSEALQEAMKRADRAEAELAKLKGGDAASVASPQAELDFKGASRDVEEEVDEDEEAPGTVAKPVSSDDPEAIAPKGTGSTAKPDAGGKHLVEPGSMDARKQPAAQSPEGHAVGEPETHGMEALREDSMMRHLLDSLEQGKDIGHYGRLTFAMIARHFLTDDEVLAELTRDRDFSEEQARQMLMQVEGRDYSPPRRERILEWQAEQEFPIIPDRHDPDSGNVYKTLRFPKETYNHIGHYQEEKASS